MKKRGSRTVKKALVTKHAAGQYTVKLFLWKKMGSKKTRAVENART